MAEKISSDINEEAWWVDQELSKFLSGLDEDENSPIVPNTQPPTESQNSLSKVLSGSNEGENSHINTQPPTESLNSLFNHHMFSHRQSAPHVPVFSASRWISPTGSYDPPPSSQPSSQMMQEPSSHTLSAVPAVPSRKGKRPAQEDSGSGITKKGRLTKKTWEQIDILREIVPHASQQTTAAQYERPGSLISGLAEPNQASMTHEGTTMSSSHVNHQAVDVTGVPETTQESFSFGTTSHGNLSFDTHPFF
ncbi:hypothetical protein ACET3Z_012896 [Daucus carota]